MGAVGNPKFPSSSDSQSWGGSSDESDEVGAVVPSGGSVKEGSTTGGSVTGRSVAAFRVGEVVSTSKVGDDVSRDSRVGVAVLLPPGKVGKAVKLPPGKVGLDVASIGCGVIVGWGVTVGLGVMVGCGVMVGAGDWVGSGDTVGGAVGARVGLLVTGGSVGLVG